MCRINGRCLLVGAAFFLGLTQAVSAAELGMGLRVGEVTQESAIVWTRVTRDAERNWDGHREQVPMGDLTYRTIRWGQGLQVWLVEGRLYRSPNNMKDGPDKTIWGKEQLAWLKRTILESNADFRVLISPTPIVGPDRARGKNDNHSNDAFAHEGNAFRSWTREKNLKNFYTCCGDRHWQYMSIDPQSGLHEFSCGPASDVHAGGNPKQPEWQPFLRVKGGFLTVSIHKRNGSREIAFRHHDVHGAVVHEFTANAEAKGK